MPTDYMDLGSGPANEEGPSVGEPDYYEKGRTECDRFLNLIRKTLGDEPPGARLAVKSNPHDFGAYFSVVCHYEDTNEEAATYALRCEAEAPEQWDPQPGDGEKISDRLDENGGKLDVERRQLDIDQVMDAVDADDGTGFCLACGAQASGCEPDARGYPCQACGERRVFGAMEVLLMVG